MSVATKCQCCGGSFTPGSPDENGIALELKYDAACMACVVDGPRFAVVAKAHRAVLEEAVRLLESKMPMEEHASTLRYAVTLLRTLLDSAGKSR